MRHEYNTSYLGEEEGGPRTRPRKALVVVFNMGLLTAAAGSAVACSRALARSARVRPCAFGPICSTRPQPRPYARARPLSGLGRSVPEIQPTATTNEPRAHIRIHARKYTTSANWWWWWRWWWWSGGGQPYLARRNALSRRNQRTGRNLCVLLYNGTVKDDRAGTDF